MKGYNWGRYCTKAMHRTKFVNVKTAVGISHPFCPTCSGVLGQA